MYFFLFIFFEKEKNTQRKRIVYKKKMEYLSSSIQENKVLTNKNKKMNIKIHKENMDRFSIYYVNDSFFLHDHYSSKEQLYSIEENEKGHIVIQGWKYQNQNQKPVYHPFSPRTTKLSSKDMILNIIHSESSIMKNHSCKIISTSNGQRFLLLKNKKGILLHLYLDG